MIIDHFPPHDAARKTRRHGLRHRLWCLRALTLLLALAVVWIWVLLDPDIGLLVLKGLGAFGAVLVIIGLAMGLGLLGFGLFALGAWVVNWVWRSSRWPDE
jgi:FtsH-binding integral membrane protein